MSASYMKYGIVQFSIKINKCSYEQINNTAYANSSIKTACNVSLNLYMLLHLEFFPLL
jgi:hypothetical protein